MTANSTEADTELGAWRQSERGGGGLGRFVGRGGRGRRRFGWGDRQRQTKSGGTDNEGVMKQEIGRLEKENHVWKHTPKFPFIPNTNFVPR